MINQNWINIIKNTREAELANVKTYKDLQAFLANNNIKDNRRKGVYANGPLFQTIGLAETDSNSTSKKATALVNVRMDATSVGYHMLTVRVFSARSEDPNGNLVKTGVIQVPARCIVAGVAQACGYSIGYDIADSIVDFLHNKDFDWGFSSTSDDNGDPIPILLGKVTTSNNTDTVYTYIEENVLERLIKELDEWGLWDLDPSGYVPFEPVIDVMTEYDFHLRFPDIPDEYVERFENLINNEINTHSSIGPFWPEHIDPNANMYLMATILDDTKSEMIIVEENKLNVKYRSPKLENGGAFEPDIGEGDPEVVVRFGVEMFTYGYEYICEPDGSMYKNGTYFDIMGGNFSIDWWGGSNGVAYDNFGSYRPIEWADEEHTKIKLGAITVDYSQVVIDENAVDLRQLQDGHTMAELMPDWWADRIKASTPIMVSGVRNYPVASDLNHTRWFLPINIPDAAIDPNFSQLDSIKGITTDNLFNDFIKNSDDVAPYVGLDPDPTPTDTPRDTPPLPTLPAGLQHFVDIYKISDAELGHFASWMWTPSFLDALVRVVQNPMDAIIGLHAIYATPTVRVPSRHPYVGNLTCDTATVDVIEQYGELNCGTLHLKKFYNNINDYLATKVQLYLPFIGFVDLAVTDVMDRDITITYNIDFMTGTCIAHVKLRKSASDAPFIAYSFSGNCAISIPITGANYSELIRNAMQASLGLASTFAGINGLHEVVSGATDAELWENYNLSQESMQIQANTMESKGDIQALQQLATSQIPINRSGNIGASAGAMSIRKPFLLITRNVAADAKNREHFEGKPQNLNVKLSSLSGYTRVRYINLENLSCTEQEKSSILNILKGGVFV